MSAETDRRAIPSSLSAAMEMPPSPARGRLARLSWLAALLAVVAAFGLAAAGQLLDLVKVDDLPLGFLALADGAIVLLAAVLAGYASRAQRYGPVSTRPADAGDGSDDAATVADGEATASLAMTLVAAALVLAPFALAGGLGALALQGRDGLWPGLGIALGLVLAATLLLTGGQRAAETSLLGGRSAAATLARSLLALSAVAMLAGQLAALAPAAALFAGVSQPAAPTIVAALLAVALAIVLAGGAAATRLAAACAGLAIATTALFALVVTWRAGAQVALAYGPLLKAISTREVGLLGQRLADVTTLKAHATAYVTIDAASFMGALASAAGGVAVLAALAPWIAGAGAATRERAVTPRIALAWALIVFLPLLVLMPAAAAAIKLALYDTIAKPTPVAKLPDWLMSLSRDGLATICGRHAGDAAAAVAACKSAAGSKGMLRLQDLGLDGGVAWLAGGRIAGLPMPLAALPVLAALAAGVAGILAALALVRGEGGTRPANRPGTTGRPMTLVSDTQAWTRHPALAVVATAVAALALAVLAPDEAAVVSWWALPVLASTLLPVLLLRRWWRRATPAGAVAGLLVGAATCLYYLVATRYFPVGFYDLWQGLSPASLGAERKLVALRQTWAAADDAGRAAAWQALVAHARGMASWWGLKPAAAGVIGFPAAFVSMVVVSLATRRERAE